MGLFKKKEDGDLQIGSIDYGALREFSKAVKDLKRKERGEAMKGVMKSLGNALPKGVHDPNNRVVNRHLYIPGMTGDKARKRKLY